MNAIATQVPKPKSPLALSNGWVTAEELAELPEPREGGKQELVYGKIEIMAPVGLGHGQNQGKVYKALDRWNERVALGEVTVETGYILAREPDLVRGPDVSFIRTSRLPPDQKQPDFVEAAPDLAVEIMSKSDTHAKIETKVDEYLRHGVALVWVINPDRGTLTVYRHGIAPAILGIADTLDGGDVLPGFSCVVGDLT